MAREGCSKGAGARVAERRLRIRPIELKRLTVNHIAEDIDLTGKLLRWLRCGSVRLVKDGIRGAGWKLKISASGAEARVFPVARLSHHPATVGRHTCGHWV